MLAQVSVRGGTKITITAPAGWTLIDRIDDEETQGQAVYYRVSNGSEPASYTWNLSQNAYAAGGILVFSGVDAVVPVDDWSERRNGSSNNITLNGVTTTVANAMLVGIVTNADGRSNFTPPAGMTERYDTQFGSGQDSAIAVSAFDAVQLLAGASGNRTATATRSVVSVTHLIALRPTASAIVVPGLFNAFETTTAAGSTSGVIRTKIAATSFALDVVALKTGGLTIETAFVGDVKLELVNAAAGGTCAGYPTIDTLGTLTFGLTDLGRKTFSGIVEPNAWPNARVRISYPASGLATLVACSTDNFAVRPANFGSLTASDADSGSAGSARVLNNTGANGGYVHKAGQPFTVAAAVLPASAMNYSGTPTAIVSACGGSGCPASLGTVSLGGATASSAFLSTSASYSEVGAFTLQLQDQTFAAVDADDTSGDCTASGRYVCSGEIDVGRFVPDHFDLALASTPQFKTFNDTTCVTRSFNYVGQPVGYLTLPQAKITAKNAGGGTTTNYAGALWKLTEADATQTYAAASGTLDTGLVGPPVLVKTGNGEGTLTANSADVVAFTRGAPIVPFNALIDLTMSVSDAAESGVTGNGTIDTATPALFDDIAFDAGNEIRFGRLALWNAHGSELLALPVTMETQFWNGTGFTRNTADQCTRLEATHVALANWQRSLAPCETRVTLTGRFVAGRGNLRFSAPGDGNTGSVDLTVNLDAIGGGSACVGAVATPATGAAQTWLQGGAAYNQNPAARASFGLHRASRALIYIREMH